MSYHLALANDVSCIPRFADSAKKAEHEPQSEKQSCALTKRFVETTVTAIIRYRAAAMNAPFLIIRWLIVFSSHRARGCAFS